MIEFGAARAAAGRGAVQHPARRAQAGRPGAPCAGRMRHCCVQGQALGFHMPDPQFQVCLARPCMLWCAAAVRHCLSQCFCHAKWACYAQGICVGAGVAGRPLSRGRRAALQPPGGRLRRPAALQCAPTGLSCKASVTWLYTPVLHAQDIGCRCVLFLMAIPCFCAHMQPDLAVSTCTFSCYY